MNCAKCNKKLAETAKFCKYCGTPVTAEEAVQAPSSQGDDPRYIYSGPPLTEQEPAPNLPLEHQLEPNEKKKRAPAIVLLCILLVLAVGAIGLVYNNNYKVVLAAVGLGQETEPEKMTEWTEPIPTTPTQTTEAPVIYEFGFVEVETEPPRTAVPPPSDSGAMNITYYKVVTETGSILRIRSERSVDSLKIGEIPDGGVVAVRQIIDGWAYVEYDGVVGWSSMDYLQIIN